MTDTQESVDIDQITNNQRFGFLRRLLNNFVAREWFTYRIVAAVVVVGALYHHHSITLEARFETTVEKMLDKREKGSTAFIAEAIKTIKSNMARELEAHFETTVEKMLDKREKGSRAFIAEAIKTIESNMARKFEEAIRTSETNIVRKLPVPKNCAELYKSGKITSDVSIISPDGIGPDFEVFCDQKTAGGGWTVIQKRLDGSVDFNRGWLDYKNGFGDLNGELWLGLDKIHRLTKSPVKLRVDLEDFDGNTVYAEYDLFQVANESKKYQLSIETYSGTAGDSLARHHGYPFTTKDQDNDSYEGNCAEIRKGGWWYVACHNSNLNGFYYQAIHYHGNRLSFADGVNWFHWKRSYYYSAKRAEMKIRPVEFQ